MKWGNKGFKYVVIQTVFLALIGIRTISAQINPYIDFQFDVQKFTVDDGLPGNTVNAIAKDSLGYLWFATAGGLARFDGHQFETVLVPGDSINGSSDVFVTNVRYIPKMGLAVSTKTRHYIYHIHSGQWEVLSDSGYLVYSGLPSSYMQAFSDSILSTYTTVNGPTGITFILPNGEPRLFLSDVVYDFDVKNDTLWTASLTDIIRIDPEFKHTRYAHKLPIPINASSLSIRKSSYGNDFYAYTRQIATTDRRISNVYLLHLANEQIRSVLLDTSSDINGLIETSPNIIWVSTEYSGVYILDAKTKQKINVSEVPSLQSYFDQFLPRKIYFIDNVIWIAGNGTGLIKVDLKSRKFNKLSTGTNVGDITISNLIKTIRTHEDDIWVVNHNEPFGVQKMNLKKRTGALFTFGDSYQTLAPVDLEIAENNWIYVGFLSGRTLALSYDGKMQRGLFDKNVFNKVTYFSGIIDKDKTGVWGAGRFLVYHITSNHLVDKTFAFEKNSNGNFMWQMGGFADTVRNGLWLTVANTIRFFDFKTEEQSAHTLPEFLSNDTKHISLIERDDALNNNLWITAENGLMYYEPETKRRRYFSTKDGLPNNFIYGLLTDKRGDLWLSTNKGLSKAHITVDKENLPVLTFRNYTMKDGLQSNEFNSFGYHEDEKGQFWFSGVGGINWFNPDSIKDDFETPSPIIKQVNVFNKPVETDTLYPFKKSYTLDYEESDFSIEFTGITFRRSDEVTYAYQLVGQDADWIQSGKETRARYTNLSPNLYEFKVKAANYDGIWSEPKSILIRVEAPFWLKTWFLILVGLAIIGLIFLMVKYFSARKYKKLLQELEKREMINNERARIAKDLHDELGANLTQISLLSELVNREIQSTGKTSIPLKKVAEAAKTGVTNLSEIVWSLNPKNDSLEQVVAYIQEYSEGYFNGSTIRVLFEIDESFPTINIASDLRHALLMTIKECLNNALKYSEADTIWMRIHYENPVLTIHIQDNGKGFDVSESMDKGNGIFHQLTRLKAYNGTVVIDSRPGYGCETIITIVT
ncbi:hypothetical protein EP331_05800 [bacterium]|nr:MAG: hypothetical protein EP331_05800 [bacterium]